MRLRFRARHLRIVVQTLFLLSFMVLFVGLAVDRVPGWVTSILLSLDPLTAIGTALADWTIPAWTWIGLIILAATAVFGRFFCGWICPLGTLQQLISWIAGPERRKRNKINRYRKWFSLKYVILTVVLVWAALGADHAGWLDPIPLLHRAVASGLRPLWYGGITPGGWVAFGMLAAILLLSAWMPRFYCRAICPLGALLGVTARLAPLRIRRTGDDGCSGCTLCLMACQGADEPLDEHRVSECHVCLNCLPSCAESTLTYGLPVAGAPSSMPPLDVGRRRFLVTAVATAAVAPVLRITGGGRGPIRRRHPPPRRPRRGGLPRALHHLRRLFGLVPHQRHRLRSRHDRRRGAVQPGSQDASRLVRAVVHPLRRGLPHRGAGHRRISCQTGHRRPRRGAHRNRLRRPRSLPALGHGDAVHRLRGDVPDLAQGDLARTHRGPRPRWTNDLRPAAPHRSRALHRLRSVREPLPSGRAGGDPGFVGR